MNEQNLHGRYVIVVVLNWNQYALTADCIRSLLNLNYPNYSILVVDNGSVDESIRLLDQEFANKFQLIANTKNLGYTGGNNVGISHALKQGADYILLLNNDTFSNDPNFLTKLVDVMECDPTIGLASPSIYYFDQPERLWYAGSILNLWSGWRHRFRLPGPLKPTGTGYASGCCSIARVQMIQQIGPLLEPYYLNLEDVEWSLRAKKFGWKIIYVPQARILHKVSASQRDITGNGVNSPVSVFYTFRNQIWLVRQYGNPFQKWFIWTLHIGWKVLFHGLAYIFLRRWEKLKAMIHGVREGIFTFPRI